MAKYKKKPVVIEAFKYDGDLVNNNGEFYIPKWAIEAYKNKDMYFDAFDSLSPPTELFIKTLEGIHHVSVGDYIIRGIKGEIYPCKPDIFKETYEKLSEVTTFGFGEAIKYLKRGLRVARKGWNGKGMWIEYCEGKNHSFSVIESFLLIKNIKNSFNTWVPSISDLLAEDWEVVE